MVSDFLVFGLITEKRGVLGHFGVETPWSKLKTKLVFEIVLIKKRVNNGDDDSGSVF